MLERIPKGGGIELCPFLFRHSAPANFGWQGFFFGERNLLQRRGLGRGGGCRFDVTLCLTSTYNYFQNILKVG